MGISGLLDFLRGGKGGNGIEREIHIQEFKGCKLAIDISCLLHRGVYSCSIEVCMNLPTEK